MTYLGDPGPGGGGGRMVEMVQFWSRSMWLLVNGLSPGETEIAGNTDSISDLVSLLFQSPMSHTKLGLWTLSA